MDQTNLKGSRDPGLVSQIILQKLQLEYLVRRSIEFGSGAETDGSCHQGLDSDENTK